MHSLRILFVQVVVRERKRKDRGLAGVKLSCCENVVTPSFHIYIRIPCVAHHKKVFSYNMTKVPHSPTHPFHIPPPWKETNKEKDNEIELVGETNPNPTSWDRSFLPKPPVTPSILSFRCGSCFTHFVSVLPYCSAFPYQLQLPTGSLSHYHSNFTCFVGLMSLKAVEMILHCQLSGQICRTRRC